MLFYFWVGVFWLSSGLPGEPWPSEVGRGVIAGGVWFASRLAGGLTARRAGRAWVKHVFRVRP